MKASDLCYTVVPEVRLIDGGNRSQIITSSCFFMGLCYTVAGDGGRQFWIFMSNSGSEVE